MHESPAFVRKQWASSKTTWVQTHLALFGYCYYRCLILRGQEKTTIRRTIRQCHLQDTRARCDFKSRGRAAPRTTHFFHHSEGSNDVALLSFTAFPSFPALPSPLDGIGGPIISTMTSTNPADTGSSSKRLCSSRQDGRHSLPAPLGFHEDTLPSVPVPAPWCAFGPTGQASMPLHFSSRTQCWTLHL